jgi:hypothetical protein
VAERRGVELALLTMLERGGWVRGHDWLEGRVKRAPRDWGRYLNWKYRGILWERDN